MYVHGLGDAQEALSRQGDMEDDMMRDAIRVEIKNWCCPDCKGAISLVDWDLDERDDEYCEFSVRIECVSSICDDPHMIEDFVSLFLY
tara:strand:+ start:581 stop:844 length:264 start_codon:yes stop_codon:yes gene_type:complete